MYIFSHLERERLPKLGRRPLSPSPPSLYLSVLLCRVIVFYVD